MRTFHSWLLILLVVAFGLTPAAVGAETTLKPEAPPSSAELEVAQNVPARMPQAGPGAIIDVTTFDPNMAIDGQCSLVEAIVNANHDAATHADCPAGSGPDTIELPAGTYTLTLVNNVNSGGNGLPQVTSAITINGHGSTITRSTAAGTPEFRIANVVPGGDLTLNDLTISNGLLTTSSPAGGLRSWGVLTLNRCIVENNSTAGNGGGISQGSGATLVLNDTVVQHNHAGNQGGGVMSGESSAVLNNSFIQDNTATGGNADGGGIEFRAASGSSVTMTLNHTRVLNNTAANGTGPSGGGISAIVYPGGAGVVTINDSTIAGNQAQYGGGLMAGVNMGTPFGSLNVSVNRSTISHNTAADPAGVSADGGGIETYNATLTLTNSTVSGNTVTAATYSSGGGMWMGGYADAYPSVLNLFNSTVTGNSAGGGGGISNYLDAGNASATVNAVNSIVAGNAAPAGGNCLAEGGTFTSLGYNLENTDTCSFDQPTDQPTTDPLLGPLANNGGPTETHALLTGSPAIDAASNAVCAAAPVSGVDQRGVSRPQGAVCDVGAYEFEEVPTALTSLDLQARTGAAVPGSGLLVLALLTTAVWGTWRAAQRAQRSRA